MGDVDWAGRMARLPDEDLIEIALSGDAGGYEPPVVEAAAAEMERRELSAEIIADLEASAQERQSVRDGRSTEPLSNAGSAAFAIFGPVLVVTLGIVILFAAMGQKQKAKDALAAIAFSFFFWTVVAGVLTFSLG